VIPRITCAVPVCLLFFPCTALAQDVVDFAASLIGRPYEWGAEGPDTFDCSGLTQYVYREVGIDLPRRAISQSTIGDPVGRRLQRGDLLFFSSDSRQAVVTHVGLYEGGGVMIDASKRYGRVRRDSLSDPYWTERYICARRITRWNVAVDDVPDRRDDGIEDPPRRSSNRRRATVHVLERIADVLLKRGRR
jgi:NlpC/P60 family